MRSKKPGIATHLTRPKRRSGKYSATQSPAATLSATRQYGARKIIF